MFWKSPASQRILSPDEFLVDPAHIRAQLERYAECLNRDGTVVQPYRDPGLKKFYAWPPSEQKLRASILDVAVAAHTEPLRTDAGTRSKQYVWRALKRLNLSPTPDIFDRIEDDHVVEIYSIDHKQLYHNHRFFDFAPITLEEIIGMDWVRETERDTKISLSAMRVAAMMSFGLIRKTVDMSRAFPAHRARWKHRPDLPQLEISLKWGSPLFDRQQSIVAYLIINRCRQIT